MNRVPRECGGCTLCCKLLGVRELDKKANWWCPHCDKAGGGCKIFTSPERPKSCNNFRCLWLMGYGEDDLRPDKTKVVMGMTTNGQDVILYVDPDRPEAWQTPPFEYLIDKMIKYGKRVFIACGNQRRMITGKRP